MLTKEIINKNRPAIDGLKLRGFAGKSDFPLMLNIIEKESKVDKDENAITLRDIQHDYAHLTNSDPEKDMIFAEINGDAVAYSRVENWQEKDPNDRIYSFFIHILPDWRNQDIEEALIHWCERRLEKIAQEHPQDSKRYFQTYNNAHKTAHNEILLSQGYEAARFSIEMSRLLDEIPEAELPDGIEVHPVRDEDTCKIWRASVEAFRDHWGFSEPKDEDYISYKGSKYFQPDLWQVAWDGDEVVSSVMNYIEHDYNQKYHRKRGWTENISTRREWRRRGIARALIVRSMRMHKAKGMTEVALGVDTNNPNGALKLYQRLGYEKEKTHITYRKAM
jgi:mycothiol synthase